MVKRGLLGNKFIVYAPDGKKMKKLFTIKRENGSFREDFGTIQGGHAMLHSLHKDHIEIDGKKYAPSQISAMILSKLKKDAESFMREKIEQMTAKLLASAEDYSGVKLIKLKGECSADIVKSVAFQLRNQTKNEQMAFFAATVNEGKPMLTVALSDDMVASGKNAVQMVREAAKEIQGGGGGQPFFAQAGGKNIDGLNKALDSILSML